MVAKLAFFAFLTAETAEADSDDTLPEVVVTARHILESLKDTPIAVTDFSADRLLAVGAQTLTDLSALTPGTSLFVGRGSNSTMTAYIRGVGQQDPTWGAEPGVGLYVDDVYYARPQAAMLDIYDVKDIEILRGPQGTLYGRNTIGGAINYVTADLADHPSMQARIDYGSYNQHNLVSSFSGPLSDQISIGGAIAAFQRDGWGKDLTNGAAINNQNEIAGRIGVDFRPTSDVTVRLKADDMVDLSNANPGHKEVAYGGTPLLPDDYDSYAGESARNYVTDRGVSVIASWSENSTLSVKSVTAYREGRTNTNIDFDGLAADLLDVPGRYHDHQASEELQAAYVGDLAHAVAGLFYMNDLAGGEFDEELGNLGLTDYLKGSVLTNSWAGYADVSIDLTDIWSLSAGGRYSHDAKSASVYNAFYPGLASPAFGAPAKAPILVNTNYGNHKGWGDVTPRVSLSARVTPEITGYISYSEGFRSGGFDIRGNALFTPQTENGYKPETVDSAELGLKGTAFGHRVAVSFDGFHASYKNQQIAVQVPTAGGVESLVENAAASHVEGLELETTGKPMPSLSLSLTSSYSYAQFDKIPTLNGIPPLSGFQYAPRWASSLSVTNSQGFVDGSTLTSTVLAAYRGFTQLYDTPSVIDQKAYTLVDATMIWTAPSGGWSISLKGSNLTDQRYRIGGYNLPGALFGNSVVGFYGPPRLFLSSLAVHF